MNYANETIRLAYGIISTKKKNIYSRSNRECGTISSGCIEFVYYETYRDIKSSGVSHDRRYLFPQREYLATNWKMFAC